MLVYDVTRRETFTNVSNLWAKEVDRYSTNQECIKILIGNKVDRVSLFILLFLNIQEYDICASLSDCVKLSRIKRGL